MAILFECPSCRQPIEVEDAWGGQSVACCYCHNVVSAPRQSTLTTEQVPQAAPAVGTPGSREPRPAAGGSVNPAAETVGAGAGWALMLSVLGAVLAMVGWLMWVGALGAKVIEKVGPDASQAEQTQALQEMFASGQAHALPAVAVVIFVLGMGFGIAGLIISVRALLAGTPKRGQAIGACIVGACVTFCQVLPLLSAVAGGHTASGG